MSRPPSCPKTTMAKENKIAERLKTPDQFDPVHRCFARFGNDPKTEKLCNRC